MSPAGFTSLSVSTTVLHCDSNILAVILGKVVPKWAIDQSVRVIVAALIDAQHGFYVVNVDSVSFYFLIFIQYDKRCV